MEQILLAKELPGTMDDRHGWREKIRESLIAAQHQDKDDYIYPKISWEIRGVMETTQAQHY